MGSIEHVAGEMPLHDARMVRVRAAERVLGALGAPEHVARLLGTTPALQAPWLLSVVAMLGLSTVGSSSTHALTPFLVLAPLLPLAGVAAAYGPVADPAFEISQATPTSSFRLILLRTAAVLASSGTVMLISGLLDAGPGWRAAAWLMPSLALCVTSLLLGTFVGPLRSAMIVAWLWIAAILTAQVKMDEPGRFFGGTAQLSFSAIAVIAAIVTVRRRDHVEMRQRRIRREVIGAADAERRKLERNLHDGAQQQLIALKLKVHLARTLMERGDERAARDMLSGLEGGLDEAVTDLRELARGLSPPVLSEHGLAVALRARIERSGLPATVDGDETGRYPPELESTVYFCCSEALQNASKYASASRIHITLRVAGGMLHFSVRDDGIGFDPARLQRGAGLNNVAERLHAFGGSLEIVSAPGRGTTISGSLPATE